MRYVIRDAEADLSAPIGGKARGLAALRPLCLSIPSWVALTSDAFYDSLSTEQLACLRSSQDTAAIRVCLEHCRPAAKVEHELAQALDWLCPLGELVAVRSSAADEDSGWHSFAGQLESFLDVPPGEVAQKVKAVWLSGFSERVLAYRREQKLPLVPAAPAVLIQRMVAADAAGIAFGADPATGRRGVAIVAAVRGLGLRLASGECDGETWQVDRQGGISRLLSDGHTADVLPGAEGAARILDDSQVRAVAELAWCTGEYFGVPQDIEWAFEGARLYLLQARAITTLARTADPDGAVNIWDNSNIGESYNGVTTPLTFSFARSAYEEVYRQFCRLLRVPDQILDQNDDIFRNMLGLIRGRVYYNLLNWYRALALLPGFAFNRRFMEQMMGVKEGLPESVAARLAQTTWRDRLRDGLRMVVSGCAIVANHLTLPARTRRFRQRLNEALGTGPADLSLLRVDELAAHYRDMERRLLPRWDAPLVNDFLAMIYFGVLRKCLEKWCPGTDGSLQNDLIGGEREMISTEPAVRIREMAQVALRDPEFVRALGEDSMADVWQAIDRVPSFCQQFRAYLEKFGDRCVDELKLESPTLHDDPLLLARSVALMARRLVQQGTGPQGETGFDRRRLAEERVGGALRWHPIRRLLFRSILENTRARVRDRENLRYERTRLFGHARRIFVELGRRFREMDLLDDPRDMFYLEVQEILGYIEGTATCSDFRKLAELRRAEFDRYRRMAAPPGRFETRGPVQHDNALHSALKAVEDSGESRRGLGCCPGVVRGKVRIVADPRGATLQAGEILVAERTDPGWIMLFPAAAGLVIERGSLLSHSAIVARELGIPAVISLAGVTAWLKDGDSVELDGSRGTVTRLDRSCEATPHGN